MGGRHLRSGGGIVAIIIVKWSSGHGAAAAAAVDRRGTGWIVAAITAPSCHPWRNLLHKRRSCRGRVVYNLWSAAARGLEDCKVATVIGKIAHPMRGIGWRGRGQRTAGKGIGGLGRRGDVMLRLGFLGVLE
jgi:hypothetical protein